METETFVGQVGRLLVFGFAVGNLEGDAVVLVTSQIRLVQSVRL